MKKENKQKSPINLGTILIRVAMVLLALTLISVYLLGGALARYRGSEDNGDMARVAKFGHLTLKVTGDFDDGSAVVVPGVPLQKDAHVDFSGSEAAVVVFVEVLVTDDWSKTGDTYHIRDDIDWSVDAYWTYLGEYSTAEQRRFVYYKTVAPNGVLSEDIVADNGAITVSETITKAEVAQLANTKITFRVGAIQSGGFASVEEAWASMDR